MIVAIHQPNLLPRLKVMQKIALADLWIVLDDVQFAQRDFQHRTTIAPLYGSQRPSWLTVPVSLPEGRATKIRDVRCAIDNPVELIGNKLSSSFGSGALVERLVDVLADQYEATDPLVSLGVSGARILLEDIERMPALVRASDLRASAAPSSDGIVELCELVGATVYIADSGARAYLKPEALIRRGISILWQQWEPPSVDLARGILRNGSFANVWLRSEDLCLRATRRCSVSRASVVP
jgi:hypothetical protein